MVGLAHNSRILRFLLVLIAVVLTIFVYASYSTNTATFSPSPHLHDSSSIGVLPPQAPEALRNRQIPAILRETDANDNDGGDSYISAGMGVRAVSNDLNEPLAQHHANHVKANRKFIISASNEGAIFAKKHHHQQQQQQQSHHREPTIDEDAIADSGGGVGNGSDDVPDDVVLQRFVNNDLLEEQYVQNVDNTLGNINNSITTGNIAGQTHIMFAQQQQQEQVQSQQSANQLVGNLNISNNNNNNDNNNLNKILDSDVLIPTSNLQKFIENADKILKNITVVSSSPSDAAAVAASGLAKNDNAFSQKLEGSRHNEEKSQASKVVAVGNVENNNLENNVEVNDEALPPSVVMTIKKAGIGGNEENIVHAAQKPAENKNKVVTSKVVNATTPHSSDDTSHGILTQNIYESGHLNDEINIAKICPNEGTDLKVLILITSAPSHEEARLAIRQTWGHYGTRRDVSTAFLLGRTLNESLKLALTQENFIYGDLIRGNFIDSYNNLTLKTVSSLEWVDQHCQHAKYVLKTDDDMFINVPKLLSFLNSHSKDKHVIYGRLAKKWKPIRNKKSKYYVSTEQFASSVFPPFTTGPAYVLSGDTIHQLYVRSLNQVYLKLEDVFTTGIVAQQLGIKRVHVNEFLNRRIAFNPCNIRKTISVHMIKANEQFDLWKKLLDQTTKCK